MRDTRRFCISGKTPDGISGWMTRSMCNTMLSIAMVSGVRTKEMVVPPFSKSCTLNFTFNFVI